MNDNIGSTTITAQAANKAIDAFKDLKDTDRLAYNKALDPLSLTEYGWFEPDADARFKDGETVDMHFEDTRGEYNACSVLLYLVSETTCITISDIEKIATATGAMISA